MVRVGIIGCGKIAQVRHFPEYAANSNVKIIGCYDGNPKRTEEVAGQYNIKAYDSYEELLSDKEIDAVSICVANNAHAEISIAALNNGKHVLCEKPMATTLEDCENMVATADKSNKYLMIGQNQRLAKAHMKAKELISSGTIGKVLSFKTTFGHSGPQTWSVDPGKNVWFFDKNVAVMGVMADLGVHKTDLLQYLVGSEIVETTAKLETISTRDAAGNLIGVDDNAICIYKMSNGAIGTMSVSWSYAQEDNSTIIYGSEGIIHIYDDPQYSLVIVNNDGDRIFYELDHIQTNDNQTASGIIDSFVDCIENNHEPEISGRNVLSAMRAVFASIQSSKEGRTIIVNSKC